MRKAWTVVPLLLVLGAPSAAVSAARSGDPVEAESGGEGMTVTLVARPGHPRKGAPVHFLATASAEHADGALTRSLAFGDGRDAPPIAIPQFCLAGPGRPASATWRFTHRYRAAGRYEVKFASGVNCGGGHASVTLTVNVRS